MSVLGPDPVPRNHFCKFLCFAWQLAPLNETYKFSYYCSYLHLHFHFDFLYLCLYFSLTGQI